MSIVAEVPWIASNSNVRRCHPYATAEARMQGGENAIATSLQLISGTTVDLHRSFFFQEF
jgi:hypothetical protein